MEPVTSFEELIVRLDDARKKRSISDDAFRASLSSWYLSPKVFGDPPDDPFSDAFKLFQLEIYERIAQREYDVANEETEFDFDHEILQPYPYGTKSAQTVGAHLMSYGWLIQKMDLPPDSRILEIGSGYGTLTVHLARMGYQVTCLDISARLLEFVQARTAGFHRQIKTICGDMATVEIDDLFDAVIFNASLHHSLEHQKVIRRLDTILAPEGIVAFADEPVVPKHSKVVPYPWGIRLEGSSIWSVSEWGWLELGFQESYFIQLLQDAGWQLARYSLGFIGHADVWIAARSDHDSTGNKRKNPFLGYDSDLETKIIQFVRRLGGAYRRTIFNRILKL